MYKYKYYMYKYCSLEFIIHCDNIWYFEVSYFVEHIPDIDIGKGPPFPITMYHRYWKGQYWKGTTHSNIYVCTTYILNSDLFIKKILQSFLII